ncbi:MAG: IclR family transcriptional regulator C-terminal domain-containing protein, partial [Bacillota bacterium]
ENEIGIICLGTPVYDFSGRAIGAISVSGPAARIREKGVEHIGQELKRSGEIISAKLGYSYFKR